MNLTLGVGTHDRLLRASPTHRYERVQPPPIAHRHNQNGFPGWLRRRREGRYRIGTKWISNMDADYRSDSYRPHLLTARTHGGVTTVHASRGVGAWRRRTPVVGASALHGVSGVTPGSHLGSTLRSGRAVLTRGVSRRSGSVACIRADASPTEVLAGPSSHRYQCSSNMVETNSDGGVARLDGMATTLQDPRVAETLERMYTESREQMSQL